MAQALGHDRLLDVPKSMGFEPPRADPEVWMREHPSDKLNEYIAVYVDDRAIPNNRNTSKLKG